MQGDIEKALFKANANFLVTMGIMNYIEILGGFIIGYYQKDNQDQIEINTKGRKLETLTKYRFGSFFSKLGSDYENLLNQKNLNVYNELRCGLTHEYLPKKKKFCIYGPDKPMEENEIKVLMKKYKDIEVAITYSARKWEINNPILYRDFSKAIEVLTENIVNSKKDIFRINFFEMARKINLNNFN